MSRVFVTNYAGHDYSKAEKFGVIVPLTKGFVSFQSLDRIKFKLAESLLDSNSDDFLLHSGNGFISIVAAIVWFTKHKKLKLLVHDPKDEGDYRLAVITEKNINDILTVLTDNGEET